MKTRLLSLVLCVLCGSIASADSNETAQSPNLESSRVIKPKPGALVSLHWLNTGPSQYILVLSATAVPADGSVALIYPPIVAPANSNGSLTFPAPLVAPVGIAVSNSSTAAVSGTFTKTAGAPDCCFTAQYK